MDYWVGNIKSHDHIGWESPDLDVTTRLLRVERLNWKLHSSIFWFSDVIWPNLTAAYSKGSRITGTSLYNPRGWRGRFLSFKA